MELICANDSSMKREKDTTLISQDNAAPPGSSSANAESASAIEPKDDHDIIILEEFLPYRLTIVANQVSAPLAEEYVKRFDLLVPEWRIMAVVGRFPGITFTELVQHTLMEKVTVSRAVARLEKLGRIVRTVDKDDRRRSFLDLAEAGWAVYREIVPYAKRIERALLEDFEPAERALLFAFLDRIQRRLKTLPPVDMSRPPSN